MKAIKVDVDFSSGMRAGGAIDIQDRLVQRNLPACPTWQNLSEGYEIRLVMDGDVSPFRTMEGVTVLEDAAEIDAAVQQIMGDPEDPSARRYIYDVPYPPIAKEAIEQKNKAAPGTINLTGLGAREVKQRWLGLRTDIREPGYEKPIAQQLYELDVFGAVRTEIVPPTAEEFYASRLAKMNRK